MKSPFPGMDPYIEDFCWGDFHSVFIPCWRKAIADQLPDDLYVQIGEYVSVIQPSEPITRIGPDVFVARTRDPGRAAGWTPGGEDADVAVLEPVVLTLVDLDPIRQLFLEVKTRREEKVVTVLELLSPANKSGTDRNDYLRKRHAVIRSDAHLVELDLLLGGKRLPAKQNLPPGDYYAFVSRADRRPLCEVYAWSLRRSLPVVPVPLNPPHADLKIDLSQVLAAAFEFGGYDRLLKYHEAPAALVPIEHKDWVRQTAATTPQ